MSNTETLERFEKRCTETLREATLEEMNVGIKINIAQKAF